MKVAKQKSQELARLAALVRQMKVGMLTTIEADGSLRSRPLETVEVDAEGRLWFFTDAGSPKSARAEAAVGELETIAETYATPALVATAALARGRVELARRRYGSAVQYLRRAGRIWSEIDVPIELAQTRFLLSLAYSALGDADAAALEERTARAALARVGAPDSTLDRIVITPIASAASAPSSA